MNPIAFAMQHPVTTLMMVVALLAGGLLALSRMRVDIFPPINQPQIYVVCNYGGMDPSQMEGLIVNQFELAFQYVDGVKNVESRCIQQVAIVKLAFFPGTDMAKAMASVVSQVNRAQATMPPNVLPPLVIQMDAGSVPVGYLVLQSRTRSLGEMGDLVQNAHSAAGAEKRPGDDCHRPVRHQRAGHRGEHRSGPAAGAQPDSRRRREGDRPRQHHQPVGQPVRCGPDAAGAEQRHDRGPEGVRLHPAQARPERLPAQPGHGVGCDRRELWLRSGERPQVGLSSDHQEERRLDPGRSGGHSLLDARVQGIAAGGRGHQLRLRRVADGADGHRQRRHRGAVGRG